MKDSTLVKISLLTFILGISGLVYLDFSAEGCEDSDTPGEFENVIQGEVVNMRMSKSTIRLSVLTKDSVKSVVVFSDNNIKVKKGDLLKIRVQQSEYHGRTELIADSIINLG